MDLIKKRDLYFGRHGIRAKIQASVIFRLLGLKRINKLHRTAKQSNSPMSEALLEELKISYCIRGKESSNIPSEGAAIIVANHPTGALDGIILIDLLSKIRPDVKFMGNFLLDRIENLNQFFINVDPFDNSSKSNISGVKRSWDHLQNGGLLVIFPAGEVSTWQKGFCNIRDKSWGRSVIRFIRQADVPVIPMYIDARNSIWFHLAGKIHPMLRTALLPRELLNKHGRNVNLRIATPLTTQKAEELTDIDSYGRFIRANVEYLRPIKSRPRRASRRAAQKEAKDVADTLCTNLLMAELERIRTNHRLFEYGQYEVFCSPPELIPNMLYEIGRQREITFREIGEGTKNHIDTDNFDAYYHQMFIWDNAAKRLVGAYRMGMGDVIMNRYGLKGFYTNTLFRMDEAMGPIMGKAIELGRSFVVKDYQRKAVSLLLLWRGILHVLLHNEQYRYLIGPVTTSGEFATASKLLISNFMRKNHMKPEYSQHMKPVTGIAIRGHIDESLIEGITSIELINKLVSDIESGNGIPVLIRKYLQLNCITLGFNTDHEFCDALDALILLDLKIVPEDVIAMLSKEITGIDVFSRFRNITN